MTQKTIQNLKSIIFALAIVLGTSYVSAAWTPAPSTPPSSNVDAPINTGTVAQTRAGNLTLSGILTSLHLITPDLTVTNADGSVTGIPAGSSLIADGENTGKVKWGVAATGPAILGPLTDPAGTGAQHQVSFTLNASSEVLIFAYVTAISDAGGPSYVKLLTDDVLRRTAYYGEECGRYCGGGAASVVLSTKQTLGAGAHTLKVQTPGSRPSIYTDATGGGGVQFYIYILTPGSGFSNGGGGASVAGVTSITAGSGISVSGSTGAVTVSATGVPSAVGSVCGSATRKGTMTQFNTVSLSTDSWGCAVDPSGSNFNGGSDTNDAYRRTLLNNGTCTNSRKVVVDALERSFICVNQ